MKKNIKLEITKERLIEAADRLMSECKEASDVTSREIAKAAEVQLAMINYCFGSREALLFEVFTRKESDFKNDPEIHSVILADIPPKEKLRQLHYIVDEFLMNQYKFSKAITGYVLLHRDLSSETNSFPFVMKHYNGRKTEQECKMIAYELSSVMQLAIYRYEDIRKFSGYDLTDCDQLHKFIDLQIELFLKD